MPYSIDLSLPDNNSIHLIEPLLEDHILVQGCIPQITCHSLMAFGLSIIQDSIVLGLSYPE